MGPREPGLCGTFALVTKLNNIQNFLKEHTFMKQEHHDCEQ